MEAEFFHKGFMPLPPLSKGTPTLGYGNQITSYGFLDHRGVPDTGEIIRADVISCIGLPPDTC